jgi:Predicted membrane protein (DUF2306)
MYLTMGVANDGMDERARVELGHRPSSPVSPLNTPEASKSFADSVRRRSVQTKGHWVRRGFLLSMLAGSLLISVISLPYFDFDTLPPFVIEKLPLQFEALWLAALRVHVAAASLAFPPCLMLMTRALQRRPRWHRWIGRATGLLVLGVLVPSGVVLAFDAKGGRIVTAGFLLSAAIIGASMIAGVRAARRRDLILHAYAMRQVVGQMSVAVSSRALIVGLDAVGVSPSVAYVAALWGPVLASAAVVALISRRPLVRNRNRIELVERIGRELSPFALIVRIRALARPFTRLGR